MLRGILIGVAGTLVVLALGLYACLKLGLVAANADMKPSRMERWAARESLHATIAREAPAGAPPIPLTDENLVAGVKLYAQNCAVCHGGPDASRSKIAQGLYQKPPQLAKDGVEDDPEGETYWKIKHGIRLTGMPSFGATLDDQQLWQLTLFLKHMDSLPAAPERAWKAVKT